MLVGGCPSALLDALTAPWPYVVPREGNKSLDRRVWSVLHYLYAQLKGKDRPLHNRQVFADSIDPDGRPYPATFPVEGRAGYILTGYSPLVVPPFYSDNLDPITRHFRTVLAERTREARRRAGRARAASLTPEDMSALARKRWQNKQLGTPKAQD